MQSSVRIYNMYYLTFTLLRIIGDVRDPNCSAYFIYLFLSININVNTI